MKVLQLGKYYNPVFGGIETHVRDLCQGLSKKGINTSCFVSSISHIGSFEQVNGVGLLRFGKLIRKAPPVNLSLPFFLKQNVDKFDLVHLHMPNPCAEVSCLMAKPKKLVVTYHADIVGKVGAEVYIPIQKKVLKRADKIIVSSQQYADSSPVLKKFRHKCVVIPYSVDEHHFNKFNKKSVDKIQVLRKSPIFLFVGRLVSYKGMSYLLKAMQKVKGTLLIVGEGPLLNKLQAETRRLHLTERVHFFTGVPDNELANFYHAADVVLLPSINRAEAFGIVQLEAMAAGKPVISTRLGTSVDIVNQHMKTGILIPPRNVDALASAMTKLGEDKALRSKLGKYGKQRVKNQFSVKKMIDKTVDVYKEILA